MRVLDGKTTASEIRNELRARCDALRAEGKKVPRMVIVLVGDNPASALYVQHKLDACHAVGLEADCLKMPENVSEAELRAMVSRLNQDDTVDGFLVQLPLPKHIHDVNILERIDWRKDVDGLTAENIGRAVLGKPAIESATPRGIRELMNRYGISTDHKHIVIVERSDEEGEASLLLPNVVDKPLASLMLLNSMEKNATVSLCLATSANLREMCLSADILIVAASRPGLIKGNMVREGAVVIDVGMTRIDGVMHGDVDWESVAPKCSFISPVPGGVGPMIVTAILQNLMDRI
jgi:methylenetetrahydrofolate dehydrogenase (NADP+)/methenyltetrahydrofolate cyclohydrolase